MYIPLRVRELNRAAYLRAAGHSTECLQACADLEHCYCRCHLEEIARKRAMAPMRVINGTGKFG